MPITANVGLMGCGKTYDAIKEKIVFGVSQGRRVVTNIEGINSDRVYDYVERKFNVPASRLGTIIHVELGRPGEPDFFPSKVYPEGHAEAGRCDDSRTVVKAGDLVVIDEARRFWNSEMKIPEEHKIFFAEHRHYTSAKTNVSCDLVYIIQDIMATHRSLRALTELTFSFNKLKTLGLHSRYSVGQWEGSKLAPKLMVQKWVRKYDPEIFPLYKSYNGAEPGKELTVDKRQNALMNPKLFVIGAGCLIMILVASTQVYSFFGKAIWGTKAEAKTPVQSIQSEASSIPGVPPQIAKGLPGANQPPAGPKYSETWRISGTITSQYGRFILLVSKEGKSRTVEINEDFVFQNGRYVSGKVDGELVTVWSGGSQQANTNVAPPRNLSQ